MTTNKQSRKAFEAWAIGQDFDIYRDNSKKYDNYHKATTRFAWEGWQASRERALEDVAKITGGMWNPNVPEFTEGFNYAVSLIKFKVRELI